MDLKKMRYADFFAVFCVGFIHHPGIMICEKSHSNRKINYAVGSQNRESQAIAD